MGKNSVHDDVLELLPWFVNESLGERERQRVLTHLRDCPECRRERDELQALAQLVGEDDGSADADYRFAFRKLIRRIEAAEANRESTRDFGRSSPWRRAVPWFGAAASVLVAVLLVAVMNGESGESENEFRTLFAPKTVQPEGIPHRVALTFEQPLAPETLRQALIETRSTIVSGPDDLGIYVVEVEVPAHLTDTEFLDSLEAIEGVRYAAFDLEAGTENVAQDLDR